LLCTSISLGDQHDKTVFHNTTPDMQDQDHSVQDQESKTDFFDLRPVLSQDRRSQTASPASMEKFVT